MKKVILSILAFIIIVLPSMAHPPSEISISFSAETHQLEVNISHEVRDAGDHYIDELVIMINGREIIRQTCLSQMEKKKQRLSYVLPSAKTGDKIEVTARCNKYGNKTMKYMIP